MMYKGDDIVKGTKYTADELWKFICRADTFDKIVTAEKWITQNVYDPRSAENVQIWRAMMDALESAWNKLSGRV